MTIKLPAAYTAAQRALANAVKIEQVSRIAGVAEKMESLAIKAKDSILSGDAAELKVRATRKVGVLMKVEKVEGKQAKGGAEKGVGRRGKNAGFQKPALLSLAERGVDKNLAHRARRLELMPEPKFEKHITKTRLIASAAAEGNREVLLAAKADRHAAVLARREAREREWAGKILALPDKKYGVIYADNEWKFKTYSGKGKLDTSAENHYVTSDLDVLKARDVPSIAAKDCVLFMWATSPMEKQAHEVMEAWGFNYVSQVIWEKDRGGTGYWFINWHEILLVGTRGKVVAPAEGSQYPSVIKAPVGKHSEKPKEFYEMIEKYFPTVPKVELNARKAREGWTSWGFEAPETEAAE